ncbi:MAG: alanine racemase [Lachnospiraceae bacterium]|nr:alanine racemase [Lachnospiraceae bacterium]
MVITMLEKYQRVYAAVDLDAICYNMEHMHANLKPGTRMIGVIKTDGYGHGAVPIGRELEKLDYVFGYAVATAEEALILRHAGLTKPILILGYTFPYCYEELIRQEIRPAVFRQDTIDELAACAARLHKTVKVHIKVDTGMTRVGIRPDESGLAFVDKVLHTEGIELEGIFTHFARADETDKSCARKQLDRFREFIRQIEKSFDYSIPVKHCSNSAGIVELPEANMDVVRAGITLYGLWPSDEVSRDIVPLKPALTLKSHIVYIKEVDEGVAISYGGTYVTPKKMRVATIPVGYGDGYPRGLSNKGHVLIRGKKAPILGRVCMDQFMVSVEDIPDAQEGDEVTLIGTDGAEQITMEELGGLSGRFNYELACDLGKRIPRVYMKDGVMVSSKDYYEDYR